MNKLLEKLLNRGYVSVIDTNELDYRTNIDNFFNKFEYYIKSKGIDLKILPMGGYLNSYGDYYFIWDTNRNLSKVQKEVEEEVVSSIYH